MFQKLTTTDHSRDAAGLKYVYPVISRRAGGLSIGINFNTNNACNWRCVYCQVPGLKRGAAPDPDFGLLAYELGDFLDEVLHGNFYDDFDVDEEQRVIKDIAISGNGEPTSLNEFDRAVKLIGEVVANAGIPEQPKTVLISNGSLMHRRHVQQGLRALNDLGGEVWFKLDSATREGRAKINNSVMPENRLLDNIKVSAKLCPTWLQTCLFRFNGEAVSERELACYRELLIKIKSEADINGVLLYTTARPSRQPEADKITKLSEPELNAIADDIRVLGVTVKVSG